MASHEMPATIVPADPADYPLIENPAWFRVQDVTCSCGERPGREYPEDGLQEAKDSRPWCTEVIPENFRAVEFCSGRPRGGPNAGGMRAATSIPVPCHGAAWDKADGTPCQRPMGVKGSVRAPGRPARSRR